MNQTNDIEEQKNKAVQKMVIAGNAMQQLILLELDMILSNYVDSHTIDRFKTTADLWEDALKSARDANR